MSMSMDHVLRVAYQGVKGAYSEAAIFELFGDDVIDSGSVLPVPCRTFDDVFQAVITGRVDEALVPIENSLGGSIHNNFDLLLHYRLYIVHEIDFRVGHSLLALPDTKIEDVRHIISHPQALAQCSEYLKSLDRQHPNQISVESAYDTAGSAQVISERKLRDHACIASKRAAQVYGMKILDTDIEDEKSNYTRFLLISPRKRNAPFAKGIDVKTSIVFCLKLNGPGELSKALSAFASRDIDLTKIESRPAKALPAIVPAADLNERFKNATDRYVYFFYVDFAAHEESENARNALRHLSELTSFIVVFGSYRIAQFDPRHRLSNALISLGKQRTTARGRLGDPQKVAILGFGRFGEFLGKLFVKEGYDVVAYNKTDRSVEAYAVGCSTYYSSIAELADKEGMKVDVLVIAVSILSFKKVVDAIPWERFGDCLVVDVLSVKTYPKHVLEEALDDYPSLDILCTHPMFGPDSAKESCKGLPFVYHRLRIRNEARLENFLQFWKDELGCKMLRMKCEDHDATSAATQFITHFTGRVLDGLDIYSTEINTKGFESLLKLVDNTVKDSFDLFYAIYKYNPSSEKQLAKFEAAFTAVKRDLLSFEDSWRAGEERKSAELSFNPLIEKIAPSGTAKVNDLANRMKSEGKPVINLVAGELDVPTPPEIVDAAHAAMTEGKTKYTAIVGTAELRKAICDKFERDNGLSYEPQQIVVTNGGKQALAQAVTVLSRPYDEVLLLAPFWTSYKEMVVLAGATPVILETPASDSYHLKAKKLRKCLERNPAIRLLMICSPNNPTGAVYSREELESFAEVLRDFPHVYVLSDEIYEYLIIEKGKEFVSLASMQGMKERTIVVNGFSKAYSMTGFRIGYLAAPVRIAKAVAKLQSQFSGCPSSIAQEAARKALSIGNDFKNSVNKGLLEKRDFVVGQLSEINHIVCPSPEGAFYVFFSVEAFFGSTTPDGEVLESADDLCKYILEQHNVALVPGGAFSYPNAIRLSFATSMEALTAGMTNIKKAFSLLKRA